MTRRRSSIASTRLGAAVLAGSGSLSSAAAIAVAVAAPLTGSGSLSAYNRTLGRSLSRLFR